MGEVGALHTRVRFCGERPFPIGARADSLAPIAALRVAMDECGKRAEGGRSWMNDDWLGSDLELSKGIRSTAFTLGLMFRLLGDRR